MGKSRLLVAAAVGAVLLVSPRTGRSTVVMNSPLFEGQDLAGGSHRLADLMKEGKTTIVFFWAMRCAPCLREMAGLEELYQARHKDGLEILAIETAGNSQRLILEIMDKLKNVMITPSYPILTDPGFTLSRQFSVQVAPRTFVVNKLGEIVYSFDGYSVELKDALSVGIDALLAGRAFTTEAPAPAEPAAADLPATALSEATDAAELETSGVVGVATPDEEFEKHRYYGDFYLHKKEYEKAITSYLKCLELKPQNVPIRLKIGEAYARNKKYVEARESWEYVLRISPGNVEADAYLRRLLRGEF